MGMLINVDVETIRVNERIRVKCYQHFVSRTCDIWWNIITTVTGDQIEICAISIIGFQSVIWRVQLRKIIHLQIHNLYVQKFLQQIL